MNNSAVRSSLKKAVNIALMFSFLDGATLAPCAGVIGPIGPANKISIWEFSTLQTQTVIQPATYLSSIHPLVVMAALFGITKQRLNRRELPGRMATWLTGLFASTQGHAQDTVIADAAGVRGAVEDLLSDSPEARQAAELKLTTAKLDPSVESRLLELLFMELAGQNPTPNFRSSATRILRERYPEPWNSTAFISFLRHAIQAEAWRAAWPFIYDQFMRNNDSAIVRLSEPAVDLFLEAAQYGETSNHAVEMLRLAQGVALDRLAEELYYANVRGDEKAIQLLQRLIHDHYPDNAVNAQGNVEGTSYNYPGDPAKIQDLARRAMESPASADNKQSQDEAAKELLSLWGSAPRLRQATMAFALRNNFSRSLTNPLVAANEPDDEAAQILGERFLALPNNSDVNLLTSKVMRVILPLAFNPNGATVRSVNSSSLPGADANASSTLPESLQNYAGKMALWLGPGVASDGKIRMPVWLVGRNKDLHSFQFTLQLPDGVTIVSVVPSPDYPINDLLIQAAHNQVIAFVWRRNTVLEPGHVADVTLAPGQEGAFTLRIIDTLGAGANTSDQDAVAQLPVIDDSAGPISVPNSTKILLQMRIGPSMPTLASGLPFAESVVERIVWARANGLTEMAAAYAEILATWLAQWKAAYEKATGDKKDFAQTVLDGLLDPRAAQEFTAALKSLASHPRTAAASPGIFGVRRGRMPFAPADRRVLAAG